MKTLRVIAVFLGAGFYAQANASMSPYVSIKEVLSSGGSNVTYIVVDTSVGDWSSTCGDDHWFTIIDTATTALVSGKKVRCVGGTQCQTTDNRRPICDGLDIQQ